jgi:hypothetical protein
MPNSVPPLADVTAALVDHGAGVSSSSVMPIPRMSALHRPRSMERHKVGQASGRQHGGMIACVQRDLEADIIGRPLLARSATKWRRPGRQSPR